MLLEICKRWASLRYGNCVVQAIYFRTITYRFISNHHIPSRFLSRAFRVMRVNIINCKLRMIWVKRNHARTRGFLSSTQLRSANNNILGVKYHCALNKAFPFTLWSIVTQWSFFLLQTLSRGCLSKVIR